jgi:hypothetical protein
MGITESNILNKYTAFILKGQTVLEESHYFLQNIGIYPNDISYSRRKNEEIFFVKTASCKTNITVKQFKVKY